MPKYKIALENSEQANDLKSMLNYAMVKYDTPTYDSTQLKERWSELFKNIRRQLDVKYVANKRGFFSWFRKKTFRAIDTSAPVYTDTCGNEWRILFNAWEPGKVESEMGRQYRYDQNGLQQWLKDIGPEMAEAARRLDATVDAAGVQIVGRANRNDSKTEYRVVKVLLGGAIVITQDGVNADAALKTFTLTNRLVSHVLERYGDRKILYICKSGRTVQLHHIDGVFTGANPVGYPVK